MIDSGLNSVLRDHPGSLQSRRRRDGVRCVRQRVRDAPGSHAAHGAVRPESRPRGTADSLRCEPSRVPGVPHVDDDEQQSPRMRFELPANDACTNCVLHAYGGTAPQSSYRVGTVDGGDLVIVVRLGAPASRAMATPRVTVDALRPGVRLEADPGDGLDRRGGDRARSWHSSRDAVQRRVAGAPTGAAWSWPVAAGAACLNSLAGWKTEDASARARPAPLAAAMYRPGNPNSRQRRRRARAGRARSSKARAPPGTPSGVP